MLFHTYPIQMIGLMLRTFLPTISDLEKENLMLRYQLIVLQRQCKRPAFTPADRTFLSLITQSMKNWRACCFIVKPETILGWHKSLARWKWTTNRKGKRPLDPELKELVISMKRANRTWGPKRIHGELLKLGFQLSETTVRNVLRRVRIDPWNGETSETWRKFFQRHQDVWAIDFFTVHTAFFERLFVFVILDIRTRKLITARVTAHPSAVWVGRVLNWEITERATPPQGIVHDRDPAFESATFRSLLNLNQVTNLRCPSRSPMANAYAERMNGTLRRECTDHYLFLGERDLQRTLNEYRTYYNQARCHQGLNQRPPAPAQWPIPRHGQPNPTEIGSKKYLQGLHHEYFHAA